MTVLADTSVWIEHFRKGHPVLGELLTEGMVIIHPFVTGELACGNLQDRPSILRHLNALPSANVATNEEAFLLLEDRRQWGQGLGWVDIHLLASALISSCRLWTLDKRLAKAAAEIGRAYRTAPLRSM